MVDRKERVRTAGPAHRNCALNVRKSRIAKRAAKRKILWSRKPGRGLFRGALEKELDKLCHWLVARRDKKISGGLCRICMFRPATVAYHLIPRGRKAIRWDPDNIVHACAPCNFGEKWHRLEYAERHRKLFGERFMSELEERGTRPGKFSVADLLDLKKNLLTKLESGV